jgi:hypothetical protein
VKIGRFFVVVIYMGYLVNVGLFLLLVPWSPVWGLIVTQFPPGATLILDSPWFRGLLSGFGALHLLMVFWELVSPTLLTPEVETGAHSQSRDQS